MLLQILDRKEKLKFLDLALHMIAIDGPISDAEKKLLELLINELGEEITAEYHFELSSDLEATLNFLGEKEQHVRNLIYLNLAVLILLEEFYNTKEHFFLEEIRIKLKVDEKAKTKLMRLVYEQKDLNDKIKKAIYELSK